MPHCSMYDFGYIMAGETYNVHHHNGTDLSFLGGKLGSPQVFHFIPTDTLVAHNVALYHAAMLSIRRPYTFTRDRHNGGAQFS